MESLRWLFLIVVCGATSLPTVVGAQTARQIELNIRVIPDTNLKSLRRSFMSGGDPLTPGQKLPIQLDQIAPLEPMALFAEWSDGTSASFRLNIHPALRLPKYDVFLAKADLVQSRIDEEVNRLCFQTKGDELQDIFSRHYTCKAYALHVENALNERYTIRHLKALRGWFAANYALYTMMPTLSLYSFDTNLVDRLRELVDAQERVRDIRKIFPISLVERALKEYETENTRLAFSAARFPVASQVQKVKVGALEELVRETDPELFKVIYRMDQERAARTIGIADDYKAAVIFKPHT